MSCVWCGSQRVNVHQGSQSVTATLWSLSTYKDGAATLQAALSPCTGARFQEHTIHTHVPILFITAPRIHTPLASEMFLLFWRMSRPSASACPPTRWVASTTSSWGSGSCTTL